MNAWGLVLQGENAKYTSKRFIQQMVECSASVVREDLADVRASPRFSLLIDETTDVAVLKQLIVYVRYWKNSQVMF